MKAIIEKEDSELRILSPAVGFYSEMPEENALVSGKTRIGKLLVLNSSHWLYLPENVSGIVKYNREIDKVEQVGYKDELFRLVTKQLRVSRENENLEADSTAEDLAANGFFIRAFTTGIFYRRPSPDAAPYVEEGQKIEKGKVLGLIEVMKTFNHIVFHGTEDSDTGMIKKILVEDGQEVQLNQPLFLIE